MLEQPEMRRPVPSTALLLEVERIIRDATWNGETPISLNEVMRRMHQKSPKQQQVRDLVNLLVYMGRISEVPGGVEYTHLSDAAAEELGHVPL